MSVDTDNMIKALKEITIPLLKEKGFKGSFPHFSKKTPTKIDLLSFQFSQFGGRFVVEIACCPLEGWKLYSGEIIPPNKVRPSYITNSIRLGSNRENKDYWFIYEEQPTSIFTQKANEVNYHIINQAELFWSQTTNSSNHN
jgi:hypothetical protein